MQDSLYLCTDIEEMNQAQTIKRYGKVICGLDKMKENELIL